MREYKKRYNKFYARIYRAKNSPDREPLEADVQHRAHNLERFKYWLSLYHAKQGNYDSNRVTRYAVPGSQAPGELEAVPRAH